MVEARPTAHGFDVLLGRPAADTANSGGIARGRGGPRVIVTPELHRYLETRRYPARGVHLPIGRKAVKSPKRRAFAAGLRHLLGLNWLADHAAWWEARADDLADLTLEAFAARHGVSPTVTVTARLAIFGPRRRPSEWWRAPDVAARLVADPSTATRAEIAAELGISVGAVGRLRWVLKQDLLR